VRARYELLAELLASPRDDGLSIVARHLAASRLGALSLFVAAPRADMPPAGRAFAMADDVVAIVRACQVADEETVVLKDVAARLRHQLHAAAISVVARPDGA